MSDAFTRDLITAAQGKATPSSFEHSMISGQTLAQPGVSRNHRLADSSIRSILGVAFMELVQQPSSSRNNSLNILDKWMQALGAPNARQDFEQALHAYDTGQPAEGYLQQVYHALSVNTTNVRFGDAGFNTRIANAFDPNTNQFPALNRPPTPISGNIIRETQDLASNGLIPQNLADAATSQAKDKTTGDVLSSS